MKKIFAIALLSLSSITHPMNKTQQTIKLPSAETINKRLVDEGFNHFVEKTKIGETLGDQEKYPLGVAMAVELALYDYNEYLNNPVMAITMQMRKPAIMQCILKDHPSAITELEAQLKEAQAD